MLGYRLTAASSQASNGIGKAACDVPLAPQRFLSAFKLTQNKNCLLRLAELPRKQH